MTHETPEYPGQYGYPQVPAPEFGQPQFPQPPQYGQQPDGPPPPYWQPPYGQPYYGGPVYPPVPGTNGLAIASMVLGILWIYWIGSVLALIFGYIAHSQIKRSNQNGGGMAIAGIVLGWVGIGVLAVVIALGIGVATSSSSSGY